MKTNMLQSCGKCPFFSSHIFCGDGVCKLSELAVGRNEICHLIGMGRIPTDVALKVLHHHQIWRRGGKGMMVNAALVGKCIDAAIRCMRREVRRCSPQK